MPSIEIREVLPEEYRLLGELSVAAYKNLNDGELDPGYAAELSNIGQRVAEATVLVALDGAQLVGGVSYMSGPGTYWSEGSHDEAGIRMLAVKPQWQRRGVGTALVTACVARAASEGRSRISLHTMQAMTAAHRVYERLGFRRAPERDWEGDGLRLLAYVLDL